jgi:hypothetical protein
LVIRRTPKLNPDGALLGGVLSQFLHQAGFANAWLTTHQHRLALTCLRLLPALLKKIQLVIAAHQRA